MPGAQASSAGKRNRERAKGKPPDKADSGSGADATVDGKSVEAPCAERLQGLMEKSFTDLQYLLDEFAKLEVAAPDASNANVPTEADTRLSRLHFFTAHVRQTMERMRAARSGRDPLTMPQLVLLEEHIVTSIMPVKARLERQLHNPDRPLCLSPQPSLAGGVSSSETLSPCTTSAQSVLSDSVSVSASLSAGEGSTSRSSSISSGMGGSGDNDVFMGWRIGSDAADNEEGEGHSDVGLELSSIGLMVESLSSPSVARSGESASIFSGHAFRAAESTGSRWGGDGSGSSDVTARFSPQQRRDHCDILGQLEAEGVFASDDTYSPLHGHIGLSAELYPALLSPNKGAKGGCKAELYGPAPTITPAAADEAAGGRARESTASFTVTVKEEPDEREPTKDLPQRASLRAAPSFEPQASQPTHDQMVPVKHCDAAVEAKITNQRQSIARPPVSDIKEEDTTTKAAQASSGSVAGVERGGIAVSTVRRPSPPSLYSYSGSQEAGPQTSSLHRGTGHVGKLSSIETGKLPADKVCSPPGAAVPSAIPLAYAPAAGKADASVQRSTGEIAIPQPLPPRGVKRAAEPPPGGTIAVAVPPKIETGTASRSSTATSTGTTSGATTLPVAGAMGRGPTAAAVAPSVAGSASRGMMLVPLRATKRRRSSLFPAAFMQPREVHYQCGACSESYAATVAGNPWWLLVRQECPECHKMQIPRVDILNPTNNVEGHISFLTEACAENGSDGEGSCIDWEGETSDDNSDDDYSGAEGEASGSTASALIGDPRGGSSSGSGSGALLGPNLDSEQAAKLLVLMCHARGCPGHHRSPRLAEVCRSVKFLMLHLRDCDGRTHEGQPCPMPWCRPCTSLLHHLIQCPDSAQCQVCNPLNLPTPLRALRALNQSADDGGGGGGGGNAEQSQQTQRVASVSPSTAATPDRPPT